MHPSTNIHNYNNVQEPENRNRNPIHIVEHAMRVSNAAISRSIFGSTFLVSFSLVLANSLVPCPADRQFANDSKIPKHLREDDVHLLQQQQQQQLHETK